MSEAKTELGELLEKGKGLGLRFLQRIAQVRTGVVVIEDAKLLFEEVTKNPNSPLAQRLLALLPLVRPMAEERIRQDAKHGGAAHDDTLTLRDWGEEVGERLDGFFGAPDAMGPAADAAGLRRFRGVLIEVLALAAAGVESVDRKLGSLEQAASPPKAAPPAAPTPSPRVVPGPSAAAPSEPRPPAPTSIAPGLSVVPARPPQARWRSKAPEAPPAAAAPSGGEKEKP